MTSVKDFRTEEPASAEQLGEGAFVFSDRYSVFDWGEMPDLIPDKGASLCAMGAYSFRRMETRGVDTHYRGVVDPTTGAVVDLEEVSGPPAEMAIALTQVPDLPRAGEEYDYDSYHAAAGENYLVPLEVVFRNRVPVGSSLRRRTDPGDHGLDLDSWPDHQVDLPEPIVEFSTKYEESDRYLDREEAARIAGKAGVDDLERLAREVNQVVSETAREAGLTHEDGKIECCYHQGELLVADVTGTLDENRFSYDGHQVSKEVLRQYHRREQSAWVAAVERAKREANERGVADWKSVCEREPEPLDPDVVGVARDLYAAAANAYTGRDVFEAPGLSAAVAAAEDL
jgi:phosphoribosylaminoimidazole-succinocarboxamide synthase